MNKFLLSVGAVLALSSGLAQAQGTAQHQIFTTMKAPDCLPKQLNQSYTGTNFSNFSWPDKGAVLSWDCAKNGRTSRYAIVYLDSYKLNSQCSTLGIDRFRLAESSVSTSVFNLLRVCGNPAKEEKDKETYIQLQRIGFEKPERQEALAVVFFGERPKE